MTSKQAAEASLVNALLSTIGERATIKEYSDRPDIILSHEGRCVGVEVTELHPDESDRGSVVRAAEERAARNKPGAPSFHWGGIAYSDAIERRLTEKVRLAAGYRCEEGGALWLLVACQIPILGRAAATHVVRQWINLNSLRVLEPLLASSRLERVFIHFVSDDIAFCGRRQSGWRLVNGPRSAERQHNDETQAKAVWDVVDELKRRPLPIKVIASWP